MARLLRRTDYRSGPWPNGGGVTHDIARFVGDDAAPVPTVGGGALSWRLSLADIGRSGPFSELPGIDRVFAVVDGEVTLRFGDHEQRLSEGDAPVAFDGAPAPFATLRRAPCRALNLMLGSGRASGLLLRRALAADAPLTAPQAGLLVAFVVRGGLRIGPRSAPGAIPVDAGAYDTVFLSPGDGHATALGECELLLATLHVLNLDRADRG